MGYSTDGYMRSRGGTTPIRVGSVPESVSVGEEHVWIAVSDGAGVS